MKNALINLPIATPVAWLEDPPVPTPKASLPLLTPSVIVIPPPYP